MADPSVVVVEEEEEEEEEEGQEAAAARSDVATTTPKAVVGSTTLYENGELQLIPTPTPNPRDPLNLPEWRKWLILGVICFFGALALSCETAIGSLLPVFLLEYSGADPRAVLRDTDFRRLLADKPGGKLDPLDILAAAGVAGTTSSLQRVALLVTVPYVGNGLASYLLVPLSIAVGRRPVLLLTAALAWAGGLWAGCSGSLAAHTAARLLQGLGAGAVEALLPLVAQDLVFIHQRNRALAAILTSQGPVSIAVGVASPYVAVAHSWRWIYWITSGLGVAAWLLIALCVPETRWSRSPAELAGRRLWPVAPGSDRAELDYETYGGPRTFASDLRVLPEVYEWRRAALSVWQCLRSTLFPALLWATLINGVFMTILISEGQFISFALLAAGVPYELTGLDIIPVVFALGVVYALGGPVADRVSLYMTRRVGRGRREPEFALVNLALPLVLGAAGCLVFGAAAQDRRVHWAVLLLGHLLTAAGALTVVSVVNTFVIESYPQLAGPVLVNLSSLRIILTFATGSRATIWIQQLGPMKLMCIYVGLLCFSALGLPVLFFYGKKFRVWTAGILGGGGEEYEVRRRTKRGRIKKESGGL
ncbi:major facilitator superfamily transporter [Xylariomycetidae sp. FL2044]|nr:major facilitator superfamily transporter [Xylariomycetidae sp. FL2044]